MRTDINIGDEVYILLTDKKEIVVLETIKVYEITINENGAWVNLSTGNKLIPLDGCFKSIKEAVAYGKKKAIEKFNATIDRLNELERTGGGIE